MPKKALITGVTGQDGAYLSKFLLDKGYEVFGTYRRISTPNFWRLQSLKILERIKLIPMDLADTGSIIEAIKLSEPDELYNLAAQSFVGASFEQPISTSEVTGLGATRVLEGIRHVNPKIRFYQASTSELFGDGHTGSLNEKNVFMPSSPYAAAKLYSYWQTIIYRKGYGIFACNGILFNHESPLRGMEFVTRKVTNGVARIKLGMDKELRLGNLESKRDWGYAPEYVESMWMMLQQKEPDDFVIATDETHTVQELVETAFALAHLDWRKHVKVDKKLLRPLDLNYLKGDYGKAKKKLGWKPKVTFHALIKLMLEADMDRWARWKKGERFAWDAPQYPGELHILTRSRA